MPERCPCHDRDSHGGHRPGRQRVHGRAPRYSARDEAEAEQQQAERQPRVGDVKNENERVAKRLETGPTAEADGLQNSRGREEPAAHLPVRGDSPAYQRDDRRPDGGDIILVRLRRKL